MAQKDSNFDITQEIDVPVPMRDGTILRADVYRPDAPGAYPVLLCRTPYDKTDQASAGSLRGGDTLRWCRTCGALRVGRRIPPRFLPC